MTPPTTTLPRLILIRGLPGSGKSTLAKAIQAKYAVEGTPATSSPDTFRRYENDDWFTDPQTGQYNWDRDHLVEAIESCQYMTDQAIQDNHRVIVSNTFTQYSEIHPYLELVHNDLEQVWIIDCLNYYGDIHKCPIQTIHRMRDRWLKQNQLRDIIRITFPYMSIRLLFDAEMMLELADKEAKA